MSQVLDVLRLVGSVVVQDQDRPLTLHEELLQVLYEVSDVDDLGLRPQEVLQIVPPV